MKYTIYDLSCSGCSSIIYKNNIIVYNKAWNYKTREHITKRYHLNCSYHLLNKEIIRKHVFFNNIKVEDCCEVYKKLKLEPPVFSKECQVCFSLDFFFKFAKLK